MIAQTRLTFAFMVIVVASIFDVVNSGGFQLRDDYLDVLKLVDNRIDRGHDVSELLPKGHARDEILNYVRRLEHLKQELENDFRHTERYESEIKKLVKQFDPILTEAERMVSTKTTIRPTHPTTQTINPTTQTTDRTTQTVNPTTQTINPTTRTITPTSSITTVKPTMVVTTATPTAQTPTPKTTIISTTAKPDKQKALDEADEMIERGEIVEKYWRQEIETILTTLKYLRENLENATDPEKTKPLESEILNLIKNFEPKLEKAEDLINHMTTTKKPKSRSDRQEDVLNKADEIIRRGEVLDEIWRKEIDFIIASFRVLRKQLETTDDSTKATLLESKILELVKEFEPRLEQAENFFKQVTPKYEPRTKPYTIMPMIPTKQSV